MRRAMDQETRGEVRALYNRIQWILDDRELRWTDLAKLIGVSPKTLSSMKSQCVNPSFITVKKIAKALDISLDELVDDLGKTRELYELYWAIPRYITDKTLQGMSCQQMLTITYATSGLLQESYPHRIDVCREEKKGLFILVKTSNPSSGEFQDRLIDGRPLYELVGEKVAQWGESLMGEEYSYVGAVVGATYPEMGKVLRKIMPKAYILVPGYGAQGGKGKDLVHFFNEDGLGAIVNSSRGIIAAYKQETYAKYGEENFADASRAAVEDMIADIRSAL